MHLPTSDHVGPLAPMEIQIHDSHTLDDNSTVHTNYHLPLDSPQLEDDEPKHLTEQQLQPIDTQFGYEPTSTNNLNITTMPTLIGSHSSSPTKPLTDGQNFAQLILETQLENSQGDVLNMRNLHSSNLSPSMDSLEAEPLSPSRPPQIVDEDHDNVPKLRSSTRKTRASETRTRVRRMPRKTTKPSEDLDSASEIPLTVCSPAPFSHEPSARAINAACDYSIRITADLARSGKAPRRVRVYADGAYDMFHSGHARQLMQAKCAFPNTYLLVGVSNDADLHRLKGRTVMNEKERYEAVRHCRYVDEVIPDAPWSVTDEFLQKHKIDFVAHDDIPYASPDCEDVYKPLKDAGMFIATQRTEGISTTDVIARIVRDYDVYLRRNISRGLSRQDLNISFMKEKQLKLQNNLETMMKRGSTLFHNFDSKRRELVDQLEDISHEVLRSFIRIFGSDGRLRNWWSGRKRHLTYTSNNTHGMSSSSVDGGRGGGSDCEGDFGSSNSPKRYRPSADYSPSSRSAVSDSELQMPDRFVSRLGADESSSEIDDD